MLAANPDRWFSPLGGRATQPKTSSGVSTHKPRTVLHVQSRGFSFPWDLLPACSKAAQTNSKRHNARLGLNWRASQNKAARVTLCSTAILRGVGGIAKVEESQIKH